MGEGEHLDPDTHLLHGINGLFHLDEHALLGEIGQNSSDVRRKGDLFGKLYDRLPVGFGVMMSVNIDLHDANPLLGPLI